MLIVSKWHDFYDTASVYGIDKTCVYLRKEEILGIKSPLDDQWMSSRIIVSPKYRYEVFFKIVGFCGEIYPLVKIEKSLAPYSETFCFYDLDELSEFVKKENLDSEKKYRNRYWAFSSLDISSSKDMSRFFDQNTWVKFKDLFHKHKCPAFIYGRLKDRKNIKINPKLMNYKFVKVKDPQTAFQEIYMFLSGVLGAPEKPMIKVSDKVKAASRGHDGPYSFKKPPGKKVKWR